MAAAFGSPFTWAQMKELERQAIIYKYIMASLPVPPHLLSPITHFSTCNPFANHFVSSFYHGFLFSLSDSLSLSLSLSLSQGVWDSQRASTRQSLGGAKERMARNGGAQKTWLLIISIVSTTCTEAVPVQESLWKFKPVSSARRPIITTVLFNQILPDLTFNQMKPPKFLIKLMGMSLFPLTRNPAGGLISCFSFACIKP